MKERLLSLSPLNTAALYSMRRIEYGALNTALPILKYSKYLKKKRFKVYDRLMSMAFCRKGPPDVKLLKQRSKQTQGAGSALDFMLDSYGWKFDLLV